MKSLFIVNLLFMLCPALAGAATVVIDAADGGGSADVQAALDANPDGTTFRLTGEFFFDAPVHIEKSRISIVGDYVDTNRDGKPDAGDTWNTVIGGRFAAFFLFNRDGTPAQNSRVAIRDINFEVRYAVGLFPNLVYEGCPTDIPVATSHLTIENNYFETSTIVLENRTNDVSIDNNLFVYEGRPRDGHAVYLKGYVRDNECADSFIVAEGLRNAITNNVVRDGNILTIAHQDHLLVANNTISGDLDFFDFKIWTRDLSHTRIVNNTLSGQVFTSGIFLNAYVQEYPQGRNENLEISGNTMTGVLFGIWARGGVQDSIINNNEINNLTGPLAASVRSSGVLIEDKVLFRIIWPAPLVGESSNLRIANNHLADFAGAGLVLNGETTGVGMVNNTFAGLSRTVDVILAEGDVIWNAQPLCPAHGNTVNTSNFSTTIADGYAPDCGGQPNMLRGAYKLADRDYSGFPDEVRARLEAMQATKIEESVGRAQD